MNFTNYFLEKCQKFKEGFFLSFNYNTTQILTLDKTHTRLEFLEMVIK